MGRQVAKDKHLAPLLNPLPDPPHRLVRNAVGGGQNEEVVDELVEATLGDARLGRVVGDVAEILDAADDGLQRGEVVAVQLVPRVLRVGVDDAERRARQLVEGANRVVVALDFGGGVGRLVKRGEGTHAGGEPGVAVPSPPVNGGKAVVGALPRVEFRAAAAALELEVHDGLAGSKALQPVVVGLRERVGSRVHADVVADVGNALLVGVRIRLVPAHLEIVEFEGNRHGLVVFANLRLHPLEEFHETRINEEVVFSAACAVAADRQ